MKPDFLYHYSGNIKCFSILGNRNVRLSDIRKSNDSAELQIFYPNIIDAITEEYSKNPFDIEIEKQKNDAAVAMVLAFVKKTIDDAFAEGKLTSYVLCLSEEGDLLSQWRGYADNGKGCSIGFDVSALQEFCDQSQGIFVLEKIKYLTKEETQQLIVEKAKYLLQRLMSHYIYCKEHSPQETAKVFSRFLFDVIEEIGKTIIYKADGFSEEKEWRLYINDWLSKVFVGYKPGGSHGNVADYLEGKISYHITDNDMIPFTLFSLGDDPSKYIKSIILGPANRIAYKDIKLFLEQNNYNNTSVITSKITYR